MSWQKREKREKAITQAIIVFVILFVALTFACYIGGCWWLVELVIR